MGILGAVAFAFAAPFPASASLLLVAERTQRALPTPQHTVMHFSKHIFGVGLAGIDAAWYEPSAYTYYEMISLMEHGPKIENPERTDGTGHVRKGTQGVCAGREG